MDMISQYRQLLNISSQLSNILQEDPTESFAAERMLDMLNQRQELMDHISALKREPQETDADSQAEEIELLQQIQAADQVAYVRMQEMKHSLSVKLNDMKQSSNAYDAYYPMSGEASAVFVDKKR